MTEGLNGEMSRSRFGHNVRRPTQFVCPNSDTICPNSDKIYLTIVTFIFLLLFNEKRDSSFPSGLWIVLFWLPAETLSLKRLHGGILTQTMETQSPMFKSPTPAGVPVII